MSIILGGRTNSVVLASDLGRRDDLLLLPEYASRSGWIWRAKIKAVCDRHDVPLKAAALQFGLAHPAVAATIPGACPRIRWQENFDMVSYEIRRTCGRVKARRVIAGECAYAVIAGQDVAREGSMKSYAMALDLRDDAEVIERYKEYHRAVWDEVLEGLRRLVISKMKIFLRGSRLFMYLETPDDFDWSATFSATQRLHRARRSGTR
ncbi:UPF0734 protein DDB_G0273871/DDB_G0273177 [Geodia barretti]|uniref:UPF0734 protein DDB_G0273871/DDB_G0273177 n=1 Tax=Geodia barretti TaxID=519541 RepID=A0AA35RDL9_GEOBA|nr:UPF0734 protein DDB_G0273871/DDB_G0273177 [Geodia barretti]